jgi:peptidoglycan lytic transglycosylase
VDVVDWVESIPVAETRNYVQRVLENLQLYRLRTGEQGLAFSLASDLKR